MAKFNLKSPWDEFYSKVDCLFKYDHQIKVILDVQNYVLNLYVDDPDKALALYQLMPPEKVFGNIVLEVKVIPANDIELVDETMTDAEAFKVLFANNPIITDIVTIDHCIFSGMTYIIFEPDVVQYFKDDISDAYGLRSTLYQELAKEVFGSHNGIFFCTDKVNEGSDIVFRAWI